MKYTLLAFLLAAVSLFAGEPWPGVPYAEVRAFAWDGKLQTEQLIRHDFTFVDGVINKEGAVLNADQTKRLLTAQARRYKARSHAKCYIPHNAFVFYNAEKKPVAFLEICFDCLGEHSNPADDKSDPDFMALGKICEELKLPFGHHKTLAELQKTVRWLGQSDDEEPAREKK